MNSQGVVDHLRSSWPGASGISSSSGTPHHFGLCSPWDGLLLRCLPHCHEVPSLSPPSSAAEENLFIPKFLQPPRTESDQPAWVPCLSLNQSRLSGEQRTLIVQQGVQSGPITMQGGGCSDWPAWTICSSLEPTTWSEKQKGPPGILGSPQNQERILGRQK